MACKGCGGGSSSRGRAAITNATLNRNNIPIGQGIRTEMLIYVGTRPAAVMYKVDTKKYIFGGNRANRASIVVESHARHLMTAHPLQFVAVPSDTDIKVLDICKPINTVQGIDNLTIEDKAALIEAGFETIGQLIAVQPDILKTSLSNRDGAYVTIMQLAIKERFGIKCNLQPLKEWRNMKAEQAAGNVEPVAAPEPVEEEPKATRKTRKSKDSE